MGGAATGTYLLYQDMTETGMSGQGAPMAQVLRTEKRVKRKLASSFVWNTVQSEQPLFRRESIQTGAESSALIRLVGGESIELRENSLVVIDDTKNLMNNFIRGSLVLHQETGDSVVTSTGDGKVEIQELPIQLISPSISEVFFTPKGNSKEIRFEWKARDSSTPAGTSPVSVQISKTSAFQKLETLKENSTELPAGRYFWRLVQSEKEKKEETLSVVGQFSVTEAVPLTLTSPVNGERIEFYGDRASIEFRWVDQPASNLENVEHLLEVSDNSEFRNIIAEKRVTAKSQIARISGIPNGGLYWRIRSKWGNLNITSPQQAFRVEQAASIPIELIFPRDRAILPEASLRLSWKSELHGKENRYSVEIESTSPSLNFTKTESTQASGVNITTLSPGSYRWRVQITSKNQTLGASEWQEFTIARGGVITLTAPSINQRIGYWKNPVSFPFRWEPDPLVTAEGSTNTYQLELSEEVDFRNNVSMKRTRANTLNSSELALQPGTYHWRIQVLDETGLVQKSSAPLKFTYGVHPILGPPASATPETGTKLNPLELELDPALSWSSVENAVSYEVIVFREFRQVKKLWLRQVTVGTSISLKDAPEGIFTWSVRALDPLDRLGEPLPERKLILDGGAPLAPPKTLTREVQ